MLMHRIWMGGEMPSRYQEYGQLWKDLNPGHELRDWTEEELLDWEWVNEDVIDDLYKKSLQPGADKIAFYTQLADVLDYELIYKFGGWYFNTDLKPLKHLDSLGYDSAVPGFAMEDDVHAVNMAMYGLDDDLLFRKIIENLPKRYFSMPNEFMNATTGVQLIMQTLREYDGPVQLWHRDVFNPIHWSQFEYGETPDVDIDYPEVTVAVHEWLHRTNQRGQRVLETSG